MDFKIPREIENIIHRLKESGYEAYIVGGCVRDFLLELEPHDFDVTTSALPETVKSLFNRTIDTGIKHGTVTVMSGDTAVEVTTFRSDGGYTDFRRPDDVRFVGNLEEDLARRDFTVNAIAYNSIDGLRDFYNGKEDIKNRILRAVGDPEKRFHEDALRILRLYRFAATLDFHIEPATEKAAIACVPLLQNVSAERILSELLKAINGQTPQALAPLINCGGLKFIGIDRCTQLEKLPLLSSPDLKLFSFLKLCGCDFDKTLTALKASNHQKSTCESLAFLCGQPFPETGTQIKRTLTDTSVGAFEDYLEFTEIFDKKDTSSQKTLLADIIKYNEPYRIPDLKINGNDLLKLGYSGENIGLMLEKLKQAVIEDPALNTWDELIDQIKQFNRN